MARLIQRREFLRRGVAAGSLIGGGVWSSRSIAESKSPNEKLNIACVGTANQARYTIGNLGKDNIVACVDIDDNSLNKAISDFPKAKRYNDFRKMLDEMHKQLDAVTICTTDHTHAPATLAAMRLGKHVYTEKPLTHTVAEARLMAETAKKYKVATQMGTQIHAENNYRRVVEVIQSGALGKIKEVHTFAGRAWGGGDRPKDKPPVPPHLHWDLWLGPAPERPYHPAYHPANWRKFWDFGGGNLADMACHHMDLPFWALGLRHPTTVEAEGPPVHPETCPLGLTVRYEYAAQADRPALRLTWYDGTSIPQKIQGVNTSGGGNIFIGEKGMMYADYGSYKLFPETEFKGYKPPTPSIPNSIGHHNEWLKACREGTPTTCNFDYSGALSEAVLLGNVAYRTGKKLAWDAAQLKATNAPEADKYIRKAYRKGWEIA